MKTSTDLHNFAFHSHLIQSAIHGANPHVLAYVGSLRCDFAPSSAHDNISDCVHNYEGQGQVYEEILEGYLMPYLVSLPYSPLRLRSSDPSSIEKEVLRQQKVLEQVQLHQVTCHLSLGQVHQPRYP